MVRARGQASGPDHPRAAGRTAAGHVARQQSAAAVAREPSRTGCETSKRGSRSPAGPRPRRVVPRGRRRRASSLQRSRANGPMASPRALRRRTTTHGAQRRRARRRHRAARRHRAGRQPALLPGPAPGHRPARHGARGPGPLAGRPVLRAVAGGHRGAAPLDLLRGAADHQRHARGAPHRGPGVQGRLPPLQDHAGIPRPAPGRLGLPRAPGRGGRGARTRAVRQESDRELRDRGIQRPVPRVGAAARGRVRGTHRPAGLLGGPASTPTGPWTPATSSRCGGP